MVPEYTINGILYRRRKTSAQVTVRFPLSRPTVREEFRAQTYEVASFDDVRSRVELRGLTVQPTTCMLTYFVISGVNI